MLDSWPDGKVYHISLSDVTASRYEQQVSNVVRSCEKRLEWLQRGSRKTFGILTAHKVSVCMCVCVYVYVFVCVCMYMYICVCTCLCMHVCMCGHMSVCEHMSACVGVHVCVCTRAGGCACVCSIV